MAVSWRVCFWTAATPCEAGSAVSPRRPHRANAHWSTSSKPALVEAELRKSPPDEIYYLAAFHHATEDVIELSAAELLRCSFDVHVLGLLNVLQAMEECCPRARLFYAASSHVFGTPGVGMAERGNSVCPELSLWHLQGSRPPMLSALSPAEGHFRRDGDSVQSRVFLAQAVVPLAKNRAWCIAGAT